MDNRQKAYEMWKDSDQSMQLKDIADKLGVPTSTVRNWKARDNWGDNHATSQRNATRRESDKTKKRREYKNTRIANEIDATGGLSDLERDFCIHYIGCYNATQSAIKAGYEGTYASMKSLGYEIVRRPRIKALIEYLKQMKRETILAGVDDVIELHMRIAFSDMTQFANWTYDGKLGNCFVLQGSDMIDGNLVKEVKQTEKGMSIKLEDRQKSLEFLERYFLINPMDNHKIAYETKRISIEERKLEGEDNTVTNEIAKDIIKALTSTADVWEDADNESMDADDKNSNIQ